MNSLSAKEWLESPLHPMDCVDLVMGSVIDGTFLHIADMYSRDKSSPLKDGWFDGEESLSAAYGFKSNTNRTILMFRRLVPGKIAQNIKIEYILWHRN
jgi:hypothetical protein